MPFAPKNRTSYKKLTWGGHLLGLWTTMSNDRYRFAMRPMGCKEWWSQKGFYRFDVWGQM